MKEVLSGPSLWRPIRFYLMGIGKSSRINSVVEEIAEELGEDDVSGG